jgi:hypothetical protein
MPLALYALVCACFAQSVVAQELLFSFSPVPSNGAFSKRPFSKDEILIVIVTGMAPGERLTLERCGNARCSTSGARTLDGRPGSNLGSTCVRSRQNPVPDGVRLSLGRLATHCSPQSLLQCPLSCSNAASSPETSNVAS